MDAFVDVLDVDGQARCVIFLHEFHSRVVNTWTTTGLVDLLSFFEE